MPSSERAKPFGVSFSGAMQPLGKPFDAMSHEVLGTVASSDGSEGLVVEVLQNGFLLQGRVLRTAKVRISSKPKT